MKDRHHQAYDDEEEEEEELYVPPHILFLNYLYQNPGYIDHFNLIFINFNHD